MLEPAVLVPVLVPEPSLLAAALTPAPSAFDSLFASDFAASGFFSLLDPYRSAYQPPPLRTKLVRLTWRARVCFAPQFGQTSGAGSFTFWRASDSSWHLLQRYS